MQCPVNHPFSQGTDRLRIPVHQAGLPDVSLDKSAEEIIRQAVPTDLCGGEAAFISTAMADMQAVPTDLCGGEAERSNQSKSRQFGRLLSIHAALG